MNIDNNQDKNRTKIVKTSYGKMPCLDSEHNAPMHICLPAGHELHHVCPSCGWETKITSPVIIC